VFFIVDDIVYYYQVVVEKVIAAPEEVKAATESWLNGKKSYPAPVKRQHPV